MRVLLIVDVQNDFLPGGSLAVPHGDEVVPVINALQVHFDLVVATKDWHPAGHSSFASTHGKEAGEIIRYLGHRQELWPDHCVQDTPGSAFASGLSTERIAKVFYKGSDQKIDSYSAFFDNEHQRSTGLAEYLREHRVSELYIVGLATDYCVKYSVYDATTLGFKTFVIIDGCRGIDLSPGDVERALVEMEALGATIITSKEVI